MTLTLTPTVITAIVVPFVLVLVWAVRQEGRINLLERLHREFTKEIREDVAYIRQRVDSLFGPAR